MLDEQLSDYEKIDCFYYFVWFYFITANIKNILKLIHECLVLT